MKFLWLRPSRCSHSINLKTQTELELIEHFITSHFEDKILTAICSFDNLKLIIWGLKGARRCYVGYSNYLFIILSRRLLLIVPLSTSRTLWGLKAEYVVFTITLYSIFGRTYSIQSCWYYLNTSKFCSTCHFYVYVVYPIGKYFILPMLFFLLITQLKVTAYMQHSVSYLQKDIFQSI